MLPPLALLRDVVLAQQDVDAAVAMLGSELEHGEARLSVGELARAGKAFANPLLSDRHRDAALEALARKVDLWTDLSAGTLGPARRALAQVVQHWPEAAKSYVLSANAHKETDRARSGFVELRFADVRKREGKTGAPPPFQPEAHVPVASSAPEDVLKALEPELRSVDPVGTQAALGVLRLSEELEAMQPLLSIQELKAIDLAFRDEALAPERLTTLLGAMRPQLQRICGSDAGRGDAFARTTLHWPAPVRKLLALVETAASSPPSIT